MGLIIPEHNYTTREQTVVGILKTIDAESFLNVGFRQYSDPRNHWWIKICEANNIDWKILEIFKPNIDASIKAGLESSRAIHGDIMDLNFPNFDIILFWHGPEHIAKEKFIRKLKKIEAKANKMIILGMPNGHEVQGPVHDNPYEEHVAHYTPEELYEIGYETIIVEDRKPGHITAYKNVIHT